MPPTIAISAVQDNVVTIQAGSLAGATVESIYRLYAPNHPDPQSLPTLEITETGPFVSYGEPTGTFTPGDLVIEESHAYQFAPMKVYLQADDPEHTDKPVLEAIRSAFAPAEFPKLPAYRLINDPDQADLHLYVLRPRKENGEYLYKLGSQDVLPQSFPDQPPEVWVLTPEHRLLYENLKISFADQRRGMTLLEENLNQFARLRDLKTLSSPGVKPEVTIDVYHLSKVDSCKAGPDCVLLPKGRGWHRKSEPFSFQDLGGDTRTLPFNERFTFTLRNTSEKDYYCYLLDIMPDGEVSAIFPNPNLPLEDALLEAGQSRDLTQESSFISNMKGEETLKFIVTRQPIDVGLLEARRFQERGAYKGVYNLLEQLFVNVLYGQRGVEHYQTDEWATEQVGFEVEIRRYPTIEIPSRVDSGQVVAVQVSLTEEQITPEVKIKQGTETKFGQLSIILPAELNQDTWEIDVALFGEGFTFRGANTTKILLSRKEDSTPAIFHLTPNPIGKPTQIRQLYATLWHKGRYLAKITRDITVIEKEKSSIIISSSPQPALERQNKDTVLLLSTSSTPDLTVYILHAFDPNSPDTSFIMINSPELQLTVDKFTMDSEVSTWLETNYGKLSKVARSVERFNGSSSTMPPKDKNIARLKGFGKETYQKSAPDAFKNVFWTLKDKLGVEFDSIQIFTNDPILPWELMRPTRADGSDEEDFLGMNFRIARWHVSQSATQLLESPPDMLNLNELLVIAPQYQGRQRLPNVVDELEALQKFSGFRRMPGRFEMLEQLFESEGIIHFAGHGYVRADDAGLIEYTIQLEDGELDVLTWQGLVSGKSEAHPFVFFNACDIGQAHQFANFVEGWAPAILEGGASGYIGGLWPLGDKGAAEFAIHFYQQLLQELESGPVIVADILRHTRQQFYENGDPTFMAYVYYGYPDFYLNPSQ